MRFKTIFLVLITCGLVFPLAGLYGADQEASKSAVAYFPEKNYTFEPVVDGTEIVHHFVLQNKGTEPLLVYKVTTD